MKKKLNETPSVNYTNRFGITFQSANHITECMCNESVIRITCPNVPREEYGIYRNLGAWVEIPVHYYNELEQRGLDNHDLNIFWEILLRYGSIFVNGMCYNPEWCTEFDEGYVKEEDGENCSYYGEVSIGYGNGDRYELNIFEHFGSIGNILNFYEDDLRDLVAEDNDEEDDDEEGKNDEQYPVQSNPRTASVTAAAYQNGTGKKLTEDRVEVIDLVNNVLFKECKTPYEIKLRYEEFWNHLNDTLPPEVVVVSRVKIHR